MAKKKSSKIALALAFLDANPGATAYEAAKHARMPHAPVYARLRKDKAKAEGKCPCCGRVNDA